MSSERTSEGHDGGASGDDQPARRSLVEIYDTTLRDGSQREGIAYSCDDKLRIARRLDEMGVAFIEGGWPGSNPKDVELFERARDEQWTHATLTAFGSTRRANVAPEDDAQLRALLEAGTPACTVFGKSWTLHVDEVLRTTPDENLRMIEDSVRYLQSEGRRVVYDAEHFFDGYAADAAYALETLRAAARGGAEVVVLCDTNGGTLPWELGRVAREVRDGLGNTPLGVHAHNDAECAVANSLAAVRAGARHVQGTINGYGERCGNANLCAIVPSLDLKMGFRCLPEGQLAELSELSRFVAEVANLTPDDHMAYVGRSAFAHKGGVHVSAMRRNEQSYQHVEPELVGNRSRVVVSELSGRANVLSKAEELGVQLDGEETEILDYIKKTESEGFSYEAAEASIALMVHRRAKAYEPPFRVVDFQSTSGRRVGTDTFAEATVKVAVGDRTLHTAAEGNGPVNALDAALRKALEPMFPELEHIHLADYKVRILEGADGTGATTRVLIDHSDDESRSWSTVGASSNIIEASLQALVDGIEQGLLQMGVTRPTASPGHVSQAPLRAE